MIGIIGAGKLGMTLAKLGQNVGFRINIAGSKEPDKIRLAVSVLAKGTTPMFVKDVIKSSDIIILALPLSQYRQIVPDQLKGKLVINAMNYWWEVDGDENNYFDQQTTSSENVQKYFDQSIVIKAFNHMGYHDLASLSGQDQAIVYAGSDQKGLEIVAQVIKDFGFVPYYLGDLSQTRPLQPAGSLFGATEDVGGIKALLKNS